jgi:hypothetical protein
VSEHPSSDRRLTRRESRWLDGQMPAGEREEFERALDPARRARLEALREAGALWREDALRAARRHDPRDLAERVLAGAAPRAAAAPAPRLAFPAAAAVVLIALGVLGTLLVRGSPPEPIAPRAARAPYLEDLERLQLDLMAQHPALDPQIGG